MVSHPSPLDRDQPSCKTLFGAFAGSTALLTVLDHRDVDRRRAGDQSRALLSGHGRTHGAAPAGDTRWLLRPPLWSSAGPKTGLPSAPAPLPVRPVRPYWERRPTLPPPPPPHVPPPKQATRPSPTIGSRRSGWGRAAQSVRSPPPPVAALSQSERVGRWDRRLVSSQPEPSRLPRSWTSFPLGRLPERHLGPRGRFPARACSVASSPVGLLSSAPPAQPGGGGGGGSGRVPPASGWRRPAAGWGACLARRCWRSRRIPSPRQRSESGWKRLCRAARRSRWTSSPAPRSLCLPHLRGPSVLRVPVVPKVLFPPKGNRTFLVFP